MKPALLLTLLFFGSIFSAFAQTIDESFEDVLPIRAAMIKCICELPDGNLIIGGDIRFYNDKVVNNLIKISPDGTLDESFSFDGKDQLLIHDIEIQSTGDIIVLAQNYDPLVETTYSGFFLFQLDDKGRIKNSKEIESVITALEIQADDKILTGSREDDLSGFINRYNSDLTLDNTFNTVTINRELEDIVIFNDKIYVSGTFSKVNNTAINSIVRLNMDGSIDSGFNTGSGTTDPIGSLTFQDDGKILLGRAYINSFNEIQGNGMMRLNSDGSVDESFTPYKTYGLHSKISYWENGIYLLTITNIGTVRGYYVIKLNLDGEIDNDFIPIKIDENSYNILFDFSLTFSNNSLIMNGVPSQGNKFGLSKYTLNGTLYESFNPKIGRYGTFQNGDYSNGKLYIAGDFIQVNNTTSFGILCLNDDGTIDPSFVLNEDLGKVNQLEVINDNSILVSTGQKFFKLNDKAQTQTDFNFKFFKNIVSVLKFKVRDDGKIYVGDANNVYRINADGSEDSTYAIGSGIDSMVSTAFDFDIQGNKLIHGSAFRRFSGNMVNQLIRMNDDGSLDHTFDIGSGPNENVIGLSMVKVLDNNEIIVGGPLLSTFDGIPTPKYIAKLTSNGTVDQTFCSNLNSASVTGGLNLSIAKVTQIGSKLYFQRTTGIEVLNTDGTVDHDFDAPFSYINLLDIIKRENDSQNKSISVDNSETGIFALGSFMKDGSTTPSFIPSFILKILVDDNATLVPEILNTTEKIQVYPNPVNDKLNISLSQFKGTATLSLSNANGVLMYASEIENGHTEINMSGFSAGIYFITLTSESKTITQKVIKQ